MDIKRVSIKGLFGYINHEIDLSDNINIIMGENGVGKTVVLKIIKAVCVNDFKSLLQIDFSEIELSFNSKKVGRIIYKKKDNEVSISSSSKQNESFTINEENIKSFVPPYLEYIGGDRWIDVRTRDCYSIDELQDRIGMPPFSIQEIVIPEWYLKIFNDYKIKIIGTQRLYQFNHMSKRESMMKIKHFSNDVVKYLSFELSEASLLSAELDRSFPSRLVKQLKGNRKYDKSDLENDMKKLETLRLELSEVGFINKINQGDEDFQISSNADRTLMNVFKLYIKDSNNKLAAYKKASDKIRMFLGIINRRLKHKKLRVDVEKGFEVTSMEGYPHHVIPIDKLSSGEQNEIVLFYDLIFHTNDSSLVLIDEPEISLHLEWLQMMLDDLKEIADKNNIKMLIATHSPDFVGNNYNLVQNLSYE